jgi:hypothetical protein
MNLTTIWHYVLTSTGPSLGPIAVQVFVVGVFLALVGIGLIVLPKETLWLMVLSC